MVFKSANCLPNFQSARRSREWRMYDVPRRSAAFLSELERQRTVGYMKLCDEAREERPFGQVHPDRHEEREQGISGALTGSLPTKKSWSDGNRLK